MTTANTREMKFQAQRIVYAYSAYLLRQVPVFKTQQTDRFFTQDFKYGFKGRSLLPYILVSMRGISTWSQRTGAVFLSLPEGTFMVYDNGLIDNQLTDRPGWFDLVAKSEVVTPQFLHYLARMLFNAVLVNNTKDFVHDETTLRCTTEEIIAACESRGVL